MKPRPFYRWKSLWLGLFVLVFLGWAWVDSYRFETALTMRLGSSTLGCFRHTGATYMYYGMPAPRLFWHMPVISPASHLESSLQSFSGPGANYAKVPDYAVFVSLSALWSAWLFWHWKREQKKANASAFS